MQLHASGLIHKHVKTNINFKLKTMKNLFFLATLFTLLVGCSDDSSDVIDTDDIIDVIDNNDNNAVQLKTDATFGSILTDSEGFTLYFFAKDIADTSNCTDGCLANWPAFYEADLSLDAGLNPDDFGVITRADDTKQNTYKGWPLYTFANDSEPGDIGGDGSGDVWFVAKPDYTVMVAAGQLVGRDSSGNETNLKSDYTEGEEETFYITDAEGNTLYSFSNDKFETNTFTDDDLSNNNVWPIFEATLAKIPSILSSEDFSVITVGGLQQLTYKGWPFYYFGQDNSRGDNFGVGFPSAGVWPVLFNDAEAAEHDHSTAEKTSYTVANQGATAYLFTGEGLTNASNPSITLKRGNTYEFIIDSPGHPFLIKSANTTGTADMYNNGVTNNGTSSGTITFVVPNEAPDTLFYICEFHSSMAGTFTIID